MFRNIITIAAAAAAAAALCAAPALATPARHANTGEFVMVDNFGGNAYGYLTDLGGSNQVRACNQGQCPFSTGADGWFVASPCFTCNGPWVMLQSAGFDCAVVYSDHIVHSGGCNGATNTQWMQDPGNTWLWENRLFPGEWLTADGFANGAETEVESGSGGGTDSWEIVNFGPLHHQPEKIPGRIHTLPAIR